VSGTAVSIYKSPDTAFVSVSTNIDDVDAVVALTKPWLDEHTAAAYSCRTRHGESHSETAEPFQYRYELTVRSFSSHWLVATQLGGASCGDGESIASDIESFIWSRPSGTEVSPWDWINDKTPEHTPGPALQAAIMTYTRFDSAPPDCRDAITNNTDYVVWPTSRGMVFEGMVYSSRACLFETEVPYKALLRFMTKAGLEAAASFQSAKARDLYDDQLQ
jgi:hypothetical protein